jgi:hypothetical protein
MGESLLFFGQTSAGGDTIFQSNSSGTTATALINDNVGVPVGGSLTVLGPVLLYADNKIYGQGQNQLLVSDTQGGYIFNQSAVVLNTQPPESMDYTTPQGFAAYDGRVYFNGSYLPEGALVNTNNDLFSTDGTQNGTTQITTSDLNPSSLAVAFNQLFFAGDNSSGDNVLFAYDGSGQPAQIADLANPAYLTAWPAGGKYIALFMSGQDSTGTWLYYYDGQNQPAKIAPADAGSSGLQPSNLVGLDWLTSVRLDDGADEGFYHFAVFFSGMTALGHHGLWMSQAPQGPTTKIVIPYPATNNPYPFNLTAFNGKLYFTANDVNSNPPDQGGGTPGRGLFVYDPVTNQASEIINSSVLGLDPAYAPGWDGDPYFNQTTMTVFNNNLYFAASETGAAGVWGVSNLWRTDGILNAQGQASAQKVQSGGVNGGGGLQPCSLTTGDL